MFSIIINQIINYKSCKFVMFEYVLPNKSQTQLPKWFQTSQVNHSFNKIHCLYHSSQLRIFKEQYASLPLTSKTSISYKCVILNTAVSLDTFDILGTVSLINLIGFFS